MSKYIVSPHECSQHVIFPGVTIHTAAGQHLMLSLVEFEPHSVVQPHSHPHEQMGMLLEGELTFVIGDERQVLRPGQMWRIPGGVVHSAIAGDAPVKALDVFHPIREDSRPHFSRQQLSSVQDRAVLFRMGGRTRPASRFIICPKIPETC